MVKTVNLLSNGQQDQDASTHRLTVVLD